MNDGPAQSAQDERPLRNAEGRTDSAEARCAALEAALKRAVIERDAWAQELFESNRFAGELVVARQALADELAAVRTRERAEARAEAAPLIVAARRECERAWQERDRALRERDRAREAHREAAAMLHRVTTSTLWRLTNPIRHGLMVLLGRPRGPQ
jgi:hypothetical protein